VEGCSIRTLSLLMTGPLMNKLKVGSPVGDGLKVETLTIEVGARFLALLIKTFSYNILFWMANVSM